MKMCDVLKKKQGAYIYPTKMRFVSGTKWEYPIADSKEYWKKFCDDAEKKLRKVRHPTPKSSLPPLFKISSGDSLRNLHISSSKSSLNSIHKVLSAEFMSSANSANVKPLAKPTIPMTATSRDNTNLRFNINRDEKMPRNPKLSVASLQPSYSKTLFDNSESDELFNAKGKKSVRLSNSRKHSTTHSTLEKCISMPYDTTTLKELRKRNINTALNQKLPKIDSIKQQNKSTEKTTDANLLEQQNRAANVYQEKLSDFISTENDKKGLKPVSRNQRFSEFSVWCQYKALKLLAANKKVDFKSNLIASTLGKSISKSGVENAKENSISVCESKNTSQESISSAEEVEDAKKTCQSPLESPVSIYNSTNWELTLESSKSIPTGTRYTSGSTKKLLHPEPRETTSTEILANIPDMTYFPRKARDRCLSCLYKSFEPPRDRNASLPKTILRQRIFPAEESLKIDTSRYEGESSTLESVDIVNKTEVISTEEIASEIEKLSKHFERDEVSFSKEETNFQNLELAGEKKQLDEEILPRECRKSKIEQQDVRVSTTKSMKNSGIISASFEQSTISCASEDQSSEEENSEIVLASDDPSKSKFLAPCHAPTVFCPSLEPFRALRQKQPTTLAARIALNEGVPTKREDSIDDDHIGNAQLKKQNTLTKQEQESQKLDENVTINELMISNNIGDDKENQYTDSMRVKSRILCNISDVSDVVKLKSEEKVRRSIRHSLEFPSELPLRRTEEIIEVLRNLRQEEATPVTMLETLCKEFSVRISKYVPSSDSNAKSCNKIAIKLAKLLVDSKRYLLPNKFPSDLVFSTNQPPLCNPRQLRRILPLESYNLIAPLLDMPEYYPKKRIVPQPSIHFSPSSSSSTLSTEEITLGLLVHPPTLKDLSLPGERSGKSQRKLNPYALFLRKPRRKVVTWRPLTERDMKGYDPEATLDMRAKNRMKKICGDFCDWLKSLGGTDAGINEEILQDMFEIDFNADICKALQVSIREMPTVPTEVALNRRCPEAGELAMTRKYLIADAKAEKRAAKVQAFGTSLPWELRHVPPKNQVQKKWLESQYVPRDLETMDTIWKGITHLDSVQSFAKWLQDNSKISMLNALNTIISRNTATSQQAEDDKNLAQLALNIDEIHRLKVE